MSIVCELMYINMHGLHEKNRQEEEVWFVVSNLHLSLPGVLSHTRLLQTSTNYDATPFHPGALKHTLEISPLTLRQFLLCLHTFVAHIRVAARKDTAVVHSLGASSKLQSFQDSFVAEPLFTLFFGRRDQMAGIIAPTDGSK
jgi:hypothetical protein